MIEKPKRSKYRAEPIVVDGIRFDSKREAARWGELKLLEKAGKVKAIHRQRIHEFRFREATIKTKTGKPYSYRSDFYYFDVEEQRWIAEDVKGFDTPVGKLKLAIMEALGVQVKVVR